MVALFFPFTLRAQSARGAVVTAEQAFATQAARTGTAAAYLANSAASALVAEGGQWTSPPQGWKARPVRTGSRLKWYPVLADGAQSGELGYTTGPWTLLQNDRPQSAGEYVTVWRKQPDGKWKFVIDMSVERIGIAPPVPVPVPGPRLPVGVATPSTAPSYILIDIDRKFAAAQLQKPGATYEQYLSAEARLYRSGLSMMQGVAALANMGSLEDGYQFASTTGYLAAAGDLGYVIGTFARASGPKHPEETGSYLRIWRREASAGWRIVVEVFSFTAVPVEPVARPVAPPAAAAAVVAPRATPSGPVPPKRRP